MKQEEKKGFAVICESSQSQYLNFTCGEIYDF